MIGIISIFLKIIIGWTFTFKAPNLNRQGPWPEIFIFFTLLKCQDFMLQGTLLIYNLVKEASTSASTLVIIFYGIQTLGDRNCKSDPVFLFVKQHIPWFLYLLSLTKVLERIMVGHQNWQSLIERMNYKKLALTLVKHWKHGLFFGTMCWADLYS